MDMMKHECSSFQPGLELTRDDTDDPGYVFHDEGFGIACSISSSVQAMHPEINIDADVTNSLSYEVTTL